MINTEENLELLEDAISIDFYDLSIIFVVKVGIDEMNGTIMVKKEHADVWNVSTEDLYEAALENIVDDWKIIAISPLTMKYISVLINSD